MVATGETDEGVEEIIDEIEGDDFSAGLEKILGEDTEMTTFRRATAITFTTTTAPSVHNVGTVRATKWSHRNHSARPRGDELPSRKSVDKQGEGAHRDGNVAVLGVRFGDTLRWLRPGCLRHMAACPNSKRLGYNRKGSLA